MRPDAQLAFARAIERGPDALAEALLAGGRAAQLRGMRAYANSISHARYVALEESFPRTRALLGHAAFHALSMKFLWMEANRSQPVRTLGTGFAAELADPAARDLATVEWAWLESHGSCDAQSVELSALGDIDPARLVASRVRRHPAARLVTLDAPADFRFDGVEQGTDSLLLLTRPDSYVRLARLSARHADLFDRCARPVTLGELLEVDPEGVTAFLRYGALVPAPEFL